MKRLPRKLKKAFKTGRIDMMLYFLGKEKYEEFKEEQKLRFSNLLIYGTTHPES